MTRRIPQYLRCKCCSHTWIGVWLPMLPANVSNVLDNAHCPICASDTTQHQLHNDHETVCAAATECIDPAVPVAFEVRTDSAMSYELRLLLGKVQIGDPFLANDHARAVRWLSSLPRQIECAASYVHALAKAGAK